MKVYEAVYTDEQRQGVFGISLVENPAMEDEWIALSEQDAELQFAAVDESKKLLLGAVLIPNKKIYRNIGGNEFYITFTEDTISKLAHDFIKDGNQNNSSAEHETQLSEVSFVESWQVENPEIDKSALYGKKYEKGTWVTMAKVSPELYEKATNGTFNGFSIDALLGLQELKFNSNTIMTRQDFVDGLKDAFTFLKSEEVEKVEEVKTEEIEVKSEEVAEVAEATEEPQIEASQENDWQKELLNALGDITTNFKKMETKVEELEAKFSKEVEEKEEEVAELKTELEKQPEVEPIKAKPESKVEFKSEINKYKGTKTRVFENLQNFW